jgi:ATP-dependent Zn protease
MIPDEIQVTQMVGCGLSLLACFLMIKTIKDQNSFNSKKKKDLDVRQKPKTFMDVGGCEEAIEAVKEIIEYINNPE